MLYIFKIVSALTFLKMVPLIVPIECVFIARNFKGVPVMETQLWYYVR